MAIKRSFKKSRQELELEMQQDFADSVISEEVDPSELSPDVLAEFDFAASQFAEPNDMIDIDFWSADSSVKKQDLKR